jgi:hypothetical protein
MKVKVLGESYDSRLTDSVNRFIKEINENGDIVIDIKFSTAKSNTNNFSAMIIYCGKDEYREIVIDKVLDI